MNHYRSLLLAVALSFAGQAPVAAQVLYNTVALTGQVAPGTPSGTTFTGFIWPVINSGGKVAFTASLAGNGIDFSNDTGIWSNSNGSLGLVARAGNTAPGTNQQFDGMFGISIALDSAGNVGFTDSLLTNGVNTGAGLWLGPSNALGVVALSGMHAPGTSGVANFSTFNPPADAAGTLAFLANLTGSDTQGSNSGIWTFQGNTFQLAARKGFPAPNTESGTVFSQFYNDVVNQSQLVSFIADLTLTSGTDRGIWRGTPSSLALVARRNTPAPGTGGVFTNFGAVSMNDLSTVLFDASYTAGNTSGSGLWIATSGNSGTLFLVTLLGSTAPGMPAGTVFTQFFEHYISGGNRIVLLARDSTNTYGIWSGASGALNLIAHEGAVAPGTGGAHFGSLSAPEINANGQAAFFAVLDSGAQSIWATDSNGVLQLIALQGAALTVAPGDSRQVSFLSLQSGGGNQDGLPSSLSDAGVVAFHAQFTDNSAGVFTATLLATALPTVNIRKNPGTVDIQFTTTAGHNYFVEYTDSLTTPSWHQLGSVTAGQGVPLTVTDPQPGTRRYYHVVQQ